ncbi:MAG: hypothetical protein U5R14_04830 [Gemmatimonadota bacterium]|nr:hypothetical protein [Gemmatimonadota bacterium]
MSLLSRRSSFRILLVFVLGACSGDQPSNGGDVVARVNGTALSAEDLVALLADHEDMPASADVVEAVADLWIDYTLLARAAAEDSTLAFLDFAPMVRARMDRDMLVTLRDSAMMADTAVTDDEIAPQLRAQLQRERLQEAESTFVSDVEARAGGLTMSEDAPSLARELAANPSGRLSGRAARRTLVEWDTGGLTAARLLTLLQQEPESLREQVAGSQVETLETFLMSLARRELLLAEARASGFEPPAGHADSLAASFAEEIETSARRLGLLPLDRAPGEDLESAIARAVREALGRNLSGAAPALALGPLSYQLRSDAAHAILNAGVGRAVLELGRIRAGRGTSSEGNPPIEAPSEVDSISS